MTKVQYNALIEIEKLKDNWNNNNAKSFSSHLIDRAHDFCRLMNNDLLEIFPTACNSIQFEFNQDGYYIEFEVFEDHIKTYIEKE